MQVLYTPQKESPSRSASRTFVFGENRLTIDSGLNEIDSDVSAAFLTLPSVQVLIDCGALAVIEEQKPVVEPAKTPKSKQADA